MLPTELVAKPGYDQVADGHWDRAADAERGAVDEAKKRQYRAGACKERGPFELPVDDEGRDSAAEFVSTSRRWLEVEEEGVRLRVMWQQSQGVWGRVLCGLPRFYLSAEIVAAGRSPQGGNLCQL